jgi:ribose 1,5-bisphosphokinase
VAGSDAGNDPGLHPVMITAAVDKLRARLAQRGREDAVAAASRLARGEAYAVRDARLVTIVNDGALDAAAETFVRLLATLRYSPGVRRRA